jgi:5'-3' exoribonuclease 2
VTVTWNADGVNFSKKQVPEVFHPLMTESDSPIIDFYPAEFQIDMNGKKMTWQGIALLPFIDESRLLTAMRPLYDKLTEEEQRRNSFSSNLLFVSGEHQLHPLLESLYTKRRLDQVLSLK